MEGRGEELKSRTARFALEVVRTVSALPRSQITDVIGKQLLRCATSVGANYRAVCRAQSRRDFMAKLAIVIEECDETQYWLGLLKELDLLSANQYESLHREAHELTAIFVASRKTSAASKDGPSRFL